MTRSGDMDVNLTLQKAVAAHQKGDLATAEGLYTSVLKHAPEQADAHNLLGAVRQSQGRMAEALGHFDRATAASPNEAMFHFNRANALRDMGRLDEAQATYRKALQCDPQFHEAALNLGAVLMQTERALEAKLVFQQIVTQDSRNAAAVLNLGKCLHVAGETEEAYRMLTRAIELDPDSPEAHLALARVFMSANTLDRALPEARRAVELDGQSAAAHVTLSMILGGLGLAEDAKQSSAAALELAPDNVSIASRHAWNCHQAGCSEEGVSLFEQLCERDDADQQTFVGYAEVLREMHRPWDALQALHQSPAADTSPMVLTNIGSTFQDLNLPALAVPFFARAADSADGNLKPSESLAFQLLQLGQLEAGWAQLDRRLDSPDINAERGGGVPFWRGEDLSDKTLLIYFEQGAGEHIIQASMIADVAARAKRCIVECAQRLVPIIQRSVPSVDVISGLDLQAKTKALKEADVQIPGLHLGRHCRARFADFPKPGRTLQPDPDKVKAFRSAYEALADGRKIVGLSWISGSTNFGKKKTIPLDEIGRIFDPKKVFVVSLQYGSVRSAVDTFRQETGSEIYIDESLDQMKDLDSFFAQVASLDLVVTISNTTAHVAGATGTPAWVLLPAGSGSIWYWFLDRTDSPWYSSARLFRGDQAQDQTEQWWQACLSQAKNELKSWLKSACTQRHSH